MKGALYYGLTAAILLLLALLSLLLPARPSMALLPLSFLLIWSALSLAAVAIAYGLNAPGLFRKQEDGRIPLFIRWLFIPFLIGSDLYNLWARSRDSVPPLQEIEPGLFLAGRLSSSDMSLLHEHNISAILDVTAEFDALDWSSTADHMDYLNIPVLDQAPPSAEQCRRGLNWIASHRDDDQAVLIHCAMGRGRSAWMLAAFLLSRHPRDSIDDVLQRMKAIRSTVALSRAQRAQLDKLHSNGELKPSNNAWLIANPVAGGGKWKQYRKEILEQLQPHLSLTVRQTTPDIGADQLAREALQDKADIVIACGGDGTVSEVASQLVGSDAALGIIPFGTANSLCYVLLGISSKLKPVRSACLNIIEGRPTRIDTATCNGDLMLLLAGIGFASQMIESAPRETKNELGQVAYIQGLWQAVNQNQPLKLTLEVDDNEPESVHTSSLVVANAAPLTTILAHGNGKPDIRDGKLDITWIEAGATDDQILNLADLAIAGMTDSGTNTAIHHRQATRVRVTAEDSQAYAVDGELFDPAPLDIEVNPHSLRVLMPADRQETESED